MHGMRRIKLLTETGEKVASYSAVSHPAVGEYVMLNNVSWRATQVVHLLETGQDGGGKYTSLDEVAIRVVRV